MSEWKYNNKHFLKRHIHFFSTKTIFCSAKKHKVGIVLKNNAYDHIKKSAAIKILAYKNIDSATKCMRPSQLFKKYDKETEKKI